MNMSNDLDIQLFDKWIAPNFSTNNAANIGNKKTSLPTAADVENTFKNAYDEGFSQGYEDGLKKYEGDMLEKKGLVLNILNSLKSPYNKLSNDVINNLKKMSLLIAKQIIRREINVDDRNIISIVQRSIDLMSNVESRLTIRANPLDVDVITELLVINEDSNIRITDDPSITRGGCIVDSKTSCVDATIEEQINIIALDVFGGSRSSDS